MAAIVSIMPVVKHLIIVQLSLSVSTDAELADATGPASLLLCCLCMTWTVAVQVALPADQLTGLILSSPASQVTLQSGFSSPNFGISAPFSSGNVYALGLDTANLSIANSG